jgi:cysteine desulfurase/selenocysteine lyase
MDVKRWGADFVAFSGHKMLAGSGIGVLYGRAELLEAMPPFQGGGSMIHHVDIDHFTPALLPAKFEAGTPAIVPAIALGAAIDYLQQAGLPAIAAHEHRLAAHAHQRLASVAGVRILGPTLDHKAGIVTFAASTASGKLIHPLDIAQILDHAGVAVRAGHHCAMPLHARLGQPATTRASFYLYNTLEEVDVFAAALEKALRMLRRG